MALSYLFAAFPLGTLWTVDAEKLAEVDAAACDLFVKVAKFKITVDHLTCTNTAYTSFTDVSRPIFVFLTSYSCSLVLAKVWHQALFNLLSLKIAIPFR